MTAPAWIVEVETARVQRSAFNAYLKIPAARALKKLGISPMALKTGKMSPVLLSTRGSISRNRKILSWIRSSSPMILAARQWTCSPSA